MGDTAHIKHPTDLYRLQSESEKVQETKPMVITDNDRKMIERLLSKQLN